MADNPYSENLADIATSMIIPLSIKTYESTPLKSAGVPINAKNNWPKRKNYMNNSFIGFVSIVISRITLK